MDEGTSHIRIGLPPRIVSGDCLASPSYSMFPSLFAHACPMSDDTGLYQYVASFALDLCILGAILLGHMYVHLHGSLYPMMDYALHVYYRLFTPCLLMFHGVHYDFFTTSYCTRFAVL